MAKRFEWSDLEVFLHVAEAGSISGAAKTLGVAQPTISNRLRNLEDDLKCQLVLRGPQGITVTEVGKRILDFAKSIDVVAGDVDRLARERDAKEEGRVRLAAPDGMGAFWITPRLGDFMRLHPRIEISLDAGLWPQDPVREDLDVMLEFERSEINAYKTVPIATVHYAYFASEKYIGIYGAPASLDDMKDHRIIHHSAQKQQRDTWDPGLPNVQAKAKFETNSSAAVVTAVCAGVGVGLMPTAVASFTPGVVMVGDGPVAQPKLWLNFHMDIANIVRVRLVIDWLKSIYDPKQNPWYQEKFVHPSKFGALRSPLVMPSLA